MSNRKELQEQALEQLSEKQREEMDQMLAKRYGLQAPVHSEDDIRASTFAELFSDLPYENQGKNEE